MRSLRIQPYGKLERHLPGVRGKVGPIRKAPGPPSGDPTDRINTVVDAAGTRTFAYDAWLHETSDALTNGIVNKTVGEKGTSLILTSSRATAMGRESLSGARRLLSRSQTQAREALATNNR